MRANKPRDPCRGEKKRLNPALIRLNMGNISSWINYSPTISKTRKKMGFHVFYHGSPNFMNLQVTSRRTGSDPILDEGQFVRAELARMVIGGLDHDELAAIHITRDDHRPILGTL